MKSALALAFLGASAGAVKVDFTSDASIKDGASTIAYGLMKYYNGNETGQIPGNLPQPYFWWETGALFTALIDYWVKTGDDSYNSLTSQGLLQQVGGDNNFMPANQTKTEGNDDQGIWALAAIAAAESGFPSPSKDEPQWQDLAVNVFNDLVQRWDTKNCDGGLRWQIFTFNAGYDFKNSASNGVFFDLAARLYLQTKNTTYSDWASKIFSWEQDAGLITDTYQVLEGVSTENCKNIDKTQTSLSASLFLHGSAALYNATTSSQWKTRVDGLLKGVQEAFVSNGIFVEVSCETVKTCSTDSQAFKGFLVRSLGETAQLAPYTGATIQPILLTNAKAAAKACSGSPAKGFAGQAGTACGFSWAGSNSTFDGLTGVGEQMNALSAVVSTLTLNAEGQTNGTSPDKPSGTSPSSPATTTPKGAGNRVAADGMAALVVLGGILYGLL
ncbi:Mannan endo-1,6-alpha-mannosidase DCW1 [Trichoderma lentiforme]|uniref:Mannan endo-1,6-alpha-mannosidase n=1 Tax=Trichoderma lentiforme TaxID=1567552 RepID=A0A9P5CDX4_9HYPO|nr:Mannan endo-1,6-alpha-mannosidase DCW1 [Trichoderma lentiforme]